MKTSDQNSKRALRNIHHAIYLQWFFGFGVAVLPFLSDLGLPVAHANEKVAGGLLILLGLNIWLYVRRYERFASSSDAVVS